MEADPSTPSSVTASAEEPTARAVLQIILLPYKAEEDFDGPDTPAEKGHS